MVIAGDVYTYYYPLIPPFMGYMVTTQKNPNPQGKGQVALLNHWQGLQSVAKAKPAEIWLKDYLLSMLVLSARFSFKPVPGSTYYLYWFEQGLRLRLIPPKGATTDALGIGFGACELKPDLTWDVSLLPLDDEETAIIASVISDFHQHFQTRLDDEKPVVEDLPFYNESLPFYPRLMATALSASLEQSLMLSDQRDISAKGLLSQCDTLPHIEL